MSDKRCDIASESRSVQTTKLTLGGSSSLRARGYVPLMNVVNHNVKYQGPFTTSIYCISVL